MMFKLRGLWIWLLLIVGMGMWPTTGYVEVAGLNIEGAERRLLPGNVDVWSCDWSPDGKVLVYAGKRQGEPASKMRIWHWPVDAGREPSPLTNTDGLIDASPRWAKDGRQIALIRRSFNDSSYITSSIWLKEMSGGAGKQLTKGNQDRDPSWSPNGAQIVFVRNQGPYHSELYLAEVATGNLTSLLNLEDALLQSPWWGRDGKIYFVRLTPKPKGVDVNGQSHEAMEFGPGSIWAIDPETHAVEKIIDDEFDNRLPVLSPDGLRLAFVSSRSLAKDGNGKFDRGSLFVKDLKTGKLSYVTNKVSLNGGSLSWSPDGRQLAFFTFRSIRPAVWVITIPQR